MVEGLGQSTGNPYWSQQSLTKHAMRPEILCGPFCPHVLITWQKVAGVVQERNVCGSEDLLGKQELKLEIRKQD